MKSYKLILNYILFFFFSISLSAQEALPSANAGTFGKYIDQPVSHFSGTSSVNVPIASLSDGTLSTSVSLNYHTGGVRVAELAGPVGLGWTLSAGGTITRTVRGIRDDVNQGGYWFDGDELTESSTHKEQVAKEQRDGEPDLFTYSFAGYQGKFFFDENHQIHMIPKNDLHIQQKFSGNVFSGFEVRTPDGTMYYFGYCHQPWQTTWDDYSKETQRVEGEWSVVVSWNLERIESFDKKHYIEFDYTRDYYQYKFLSDCSKFSAYYNGSQHFNGDCDIESMEVDMWGSFVSKITTPTKEVTFYYNNRDDLKKHTNYTQTPKKLYKIKVEEGSYCQEYNLTQSYFLDSSGSSSEYKRLKLDQVRKVTCGQTPTNLNAEQPWIFEYNGSFFPKYLSKRIDHWGYYNGAVNNDNKDNLVPYSCYSNQCYGSGASRYTSESQMIKGSLKKVTYPTKGYVAFDYEANSYSQNNTNNQTLFDISSCTGSSTCCGVTSDEEYQVLTQDMIDDGSYYLELTTFASTGCYQNFSNSAWINIYDQTMGGNQVHYNSFNSGSGQGTTFITLDLSTISGLTAGHNYKFKVSSYFAKARLVVSYPPGYQNVKCGGLRIKKTTIHDGISSANNIIKNFNYDKHNEAGRSSGLLSAEPKYAHPAYGANGITTVAFHSTSVKPLTSLEGYHIGYENVTVDLNGNGKEKYTFEKEWGGFLTGYPVPPPSAKVRQGNLYKSEMLDASGNVVSSKTISRKYDDYYSYAPGLVYGAAKIKARISAGSSWQTRYVNKTYQNRTSLYRPSKITSVMDDVTDIKDIYYESPNTYAQTKVKSTNSDGKITEIRTKYTGDYPGSLGNVFSHYHMIGIPYETNKYVDGALVDGTKTIFSNFTSYGYKTSSTSTSYFPRPYYNQRYERTWLNGVLQNGSWVSKNYFYRYHNNGLLFYTKKVGWNDYKYFYYNSDKQLTKSKFKSYENEYEYFPNTGLVKKFINADNTSSSHTYDGMSRLLTSTNDCENIVTTYKYYNTSSLWGTKNYIETKVDYPSASNSDVDILTTRMYYDGIGRDIQKVARNQAPNGYHDMLQSKAYDQYGRTKYVYKERQSPYATGLYVTPSSSWLKTENHFYDSPLNRKEWVKPPNWYQTNYSYGKNESSDNVKKNGSSSYFYTAGSLKKLEITDPDGKKSYTFTDKLGRLILSRQTSSSGNSWLDTYNVYDNKSRIRNVLPPGAGSNSSSYQNLYYKYEYNGRDQLISKKVPGAATVNFTYNSKDLLNSYKDGNLQDQNKAYGYQYDSYGRVLKEGFYNGIPTGSTPDEPVLEYTYGTSSHNIDKVVQTKAKVLGTSSWITEDFVFNTCGELTSSSGSNHLNSSLTANTSSFVYDGANNITQTTSNISAYGVNNNIVNTNTYDEAGRSINNYFKVNSGSNVLISQSGYNSENELSYMYQGQSNGQFLQKTDFTYRDHGPLSKINSSSLQGSEQAWTVCTDPYLQDPGFNYGYKDLFYLELFTDNAVPGVSTTTQKNGNIAAVQWQVKGRAQGIYNYTYDHYNRLKSSVYRERNDGAIDHTATGNYNTNYNYDGSGNLTYIRRNGMYNKSGCNSNGNIDYLILSYIPYSNELRNVTDYAPSSSKGSGFYDANSSSYAYDSNGNLTTHQDKRINITYNHLNLPTLIDFINNSNKVEFLYDANGNLLQRKSSSGSLVHEKRDYVSGVEYVDGLVESIGHNEGRVFYTDGTNPRYEYNIKDHLGNTRLVYSDLNGNGKIAGSSEILWEGHYYPFGMKLNGPWMNKPEKETKYKYNGIEEVSDFGLNINTAYFRTLDPSIGRWWQIDPKAESLYSMSPYQSMGNNPVLFNDPNGDFIPQLVGAIVGGTVNLVDQALKGNVTSFGEGLAYFGTGAAAGVAVSFGQVGAARAITVVGNKTVQAVTGKFSFSDLESPGDYASLALDVGTDLLSPGLTQALSKPLTKAITARVLASAIDDAVVTGGGEFIKQQVSKELAKEMAEKSITWSVAPTKEFVVTASRITTKSSSVLPNLGAKLNFVFGKATGNAHNIQRSTDMLRNLNRVGIHDNIAGRSLMRGHLGETFNSVQGVVQKNGRILRESLLMGPNGGLKVSSVWEGDKLITVILKGG